MADKTKTIEVLHECHVRAAGERNQPRAVGDVVTVDERTAHHLVGIGRAKFASKEPILPASARPVERDSEIADKRKIRG